MSTIKRELPYTDTPLKELLRIERIRRQMNFSGRTGKIICGCGKGYASESLTSPHYGRCSICYRKNLTRRELNALGLKRP